MQLLVHSRYDVPRVPACVHKASKRVHLKFIKISLLYLTLFFDPLNGSSQLSDLILIPHSFALSKVTALICIHILLRDLLNILRLKP